MAASLISSARRTLEEWYTEHGPARVPPPGSDSIAMYRMPNLVPRAGVKTDIWPIRVKWTTKVFNG